MRNLDGKKTSNQYVRDHTNKRNHYASKSKRSINAMIMQPSKNNLTRGQCCKKIKNSSIDSGDQISNGCSNQHHEQQYESEVTFDGTPQYHGCVTLLASASTETNMRKLKRKKGWHNKGQHNKKEIVNPLHDCVLHVNHRRYDKVKHGLPSQVRRIKKKIDINDDEEQAFWENDMAIGINSEGVHPTTQISLIQVIPKHILSSLEAKSASFPAMESRQEATIPNIGINIGTNDDRVDEQPQLLPLEILDAPIQVDDTLCFDDMGEWLDVDAHHLTGDNDFFKEFDDWLLVT